MTDMNEYQPRTAERLIEILNAQAGYSNERSWQAEAAAEIVRLTAERTATAKIYFDYAQLNSEMADMEARALAADRRAEKMRERKGSILAGLELLLAATHADDPKREMLVRIGDLMRDVRALDLTAKEPS